MAQFAKQNFFDKCFKDKNGKVTLAQKPNLPIIVWLFTLILSQFFSGIFGKTLQVVAFGSIFTWAWLELFKGTNYFRRTLGLIVIIVATWNQIK